MTSRRTDRQYLRVAVRRCVMVGTEGTVVGIWVGTYPYLEIG